MTLLILDETTSLVRQGGSIAGRRVESCQGWQIFCVGKMFQEFRLPGLRFNNFEIAGNLFFDLAGNMLGNPGIAFVYSIADSGTGFLDSATVPVAAENRHHDQQEHGT